MAYLAIEPLGFRRGLTELLPRFSNSKAFFGECFSYFFIEFLHFEGVTEVKSHALSQLVTLVIRTVSTLLR